MLPAVCRRLQDGSHPLLLCRLLLLHTRTDSDLASHSVQAQVGIMGELRCSSHLQDLNL